ncbi:MAG: hypothetical protein LBK83_12095 [Treponema sp.]|jgi:transposase InsO family protein|nr:hypothetical protein [Treponema sp.]
MGVRPHLSADRGGVYLTVVLDRFDRKAVGWALSADLESVHATLPALGTALKNRQAQEGLVFHSDRGYSTAPKVFAAACVNPVLRSAGA